MRVCSQRKRIQPVPETFLGSAGGEGRLLVVTGGWLASEKVNRRVLDPFLKQCDFLQDILLTSAFFGLNIKP